MGSFDVMNRFCVKSLIKKRRGPREGISAGPQGGSSGASMFGDQAPTALGKAVANLGGDHICW